MKVLKIINFICLGLFAGCYYDNEEDLYPANECNTASVSYQSDIAPIIQANCLSCHALGSTVTSVNLQGHAKFSERSKNGSISGVINHKPGFSPMPQGGAKLSNCNIQKIEAWIASGSPNN
ncbi:MAG: cytochrome c [Saprospiraceae bacterium]|nr:cytochrome c [Saprospiraceae bacterium]